MPSWLNCLDPVLLNGTKNEEDMLLFYGHYIVRSRLPQEFGAIFYITARQVAINHFIYLSVIQAEPAS